MDRGCWQATVHGVTLKRQREGIGKGLVEVRAGEGRLGGGWGLPGKRRHWGKEWQPRGVLTPSGRPDPRLF